MADRLIITVGNSDTDCVDSDWFWISKGQNSERKRDFVADSWRLWMLAYQILLALFDDSVDL